MFMFTKIKKNTTVYNIFNDCIEMARVIPKHIIMWYAQNVGYLIGKQLVIQYSIAILSIFSIFY